MKQGSARNLSPNTMQRQRRGMLAVVHIAKSQLKLSDPEYRAILEGFGVNSSSAMSLDELEKLIKYLEGLGFKKKPKTTGPRRWKHQHGNQVEALHERIRSEAAELDRGERRLPGLVKKNCGVDDLRFCQDVGKLKRVLKVVRILKEQDGQGIYD